jgi:hypothetical protein
MRPRRGCSKVILLADNRRNTPLLRGIPVSEEMLEEIFLHRFSVSLIFKGIWDENSFVKLNG